MTCSKIIAIFPILLHRKCRQDQSKKSLDYFNSPKTRNSEKLRSVWGNLAAKVDPHEAMCLFRMEGNFLVSWRDSFPATFPNFGFREAWIFCPTAPTSCSRILHQSLETPAPRLPGHSGRLTRQKHRRPPWENTVAGGGG